MAQHTDLELETLTVVKLTIDILVTERYTGIQIQKSMLIQKQTFGGPTLGYVMTENWIYGCCGLNEDVGDSHLGHTENGHKKTVPKIRSVNHIKTLLE